MEDSSVELGFWETYLHKYEDSLTEEEKHKVEQLISQAWHKMLNEGFMVNGSLDDSLTKPEH